MIGQCGLGRKGGGATKTENAKATQQDFMTRTGQPSLEWQEAANQSVQQWKLKTRQREIYLEEKRKRMWRKKKQK